LKILTALLAQLKLWLEEFKDQLWLM
jgi:hypothetical protein